MANDPPPNKPPAPEAPSFWAELKRRKVMRVAITYAVVAWLIMQVAGLTFENFGIPVWAFRFVVLMLLLGFPVALIITWAFELTPDGIKTTKHAREDGGEKTVSKNQERKRNWLTILFAAGLPTLIFGTLAIFFYFRSGTSDPSSLAPSPSALQVQDLNKSIAVLPFDNRSNLEEDQFFTDGIHDDLLTQISRISDIKTISRTSVMGYKDTTKNMKQIGEELGVATLLEGGVQRAGNRVRINMQLIDASTDAHLWADTYTRELTAENIFEIQSEITQAIAEALKAILSDEEKNRIKELPTDNLEALEAYFMGIGTDFSTQGLEKQIQSLNQAVELDPDFALAHARLAHAYQSQIWYSGLTLEEQQKLADPHLKRAFELDPNLAEAWVVKGLFERDFDDYEAATESYEKAISLNPNYESAYHNYSILLFWQLNQPEKALEMANKAINLNPDNPDLYLHKSDILSRLGRPAESRQLWEAMNKRYPDNANIQMQVAANLSYETGRFDLGIKALRRAHFLDPENPQIVYELFRNYRRIGDKDKQRFWLKRGGELFQNSEYTAIFKVRLPLLDDDLEAAHRIWIREYASGNLRNTVPHVSLVFDLSDKDLLQNHPERILERYRILVPGYFKDNFELPNVTYSVNFHSLDNLLYLSEAWRKQGDTVKADVLLRRVTEKMEQEDVINLYRFPTWLLLSLNGKKEELLALLKEAKHQPHYSPLEDAYFASISEEPLILERRRQHAAWQQDMGEKIADMEANGEMAPIPEVDKG